VVLTPEQFAERLRVDVYDTIVAEYPSPNWNARSTSPSAPHGSLRFHSISIGSTGTITLDCPSPISCRMSSACVSQGEQSEVGAYEVIVENITQQRELRIIRGDRRPAIR
jgi:hypothetical protein